jgi:hypothetical protein
MKKFVEFSVYLCIAGTVFVAFYWHKSVRSETIKEERHPGIHPSTWDPSDNWKIRKIVQIDGSFAQVAPLVDDKPAKGFVPLSHREIVQLERHQIPEVKVGDKIRYRIHPITGSTLAIEKWVD